MTFRYAARCVVRSFSVLFVAIVVNFALPRLAPGNAIDYLVPPEQAASLSADQRLAVIRQFGLEQSTMQQFVRYVTRLAHGDLLLSIRYARALR